MIFVLQKFQPLYNLKRIFKEVESTEESLTWNHLKGLTKLPRSSFPELFKYLKMQACLRERT